MKLWPTFRKKVSETKSGNPLDLFSFLALNGWGRVAAYQAMRYYEQVAPVGTAIDLITDEIKNLDLSIHDSTSGDYDTAHPLIQKLKRPNPVQSGISFLKELSAVYQTTGEVFVLGIGTRNRIPLELYVIRPHQVTETLGGDGLIKTLVVTRRGTSTTFNRVEDRGIVRFMDGADRELWPIAEFNPSPNSNYRGASRLNSIYYEIEQHMHASRHNLSLLKNGGRLSGALVTNEVLSDDEFERLQQQVQQFYAGSDNAGRIFLGTGGVKYEEMGKSNKDMDFMSLKSEITVAIYNRLKIPLPLINASTMTMANMDAAKLNLYDNAVLPLAWHLLGELDAMLRTRSGLKDTQQIAIDPESIDALQPRNLENLTARSGLGIYSINELRAKDGAEAVDGGNTILQPATMVPVAQDVSTDDNRTRPASKAARDAFFEIMREQKKWTEEQIARFADEEGL